MAHESATSTRNVAAAAIAAPDDDVAARHLVPRQAGEVQRHPLPGLGALHRLVVDLDGADTGAAPGREHLHLVAARRHAPTTACR